MVLFLINLLITVLIFTGGVLVIQLEISIGTLITLLTYFTMLSMPTRFLAFSLIIYQRTRAAGERVFTLLEQPTEISLSSSGKPYPDNNTPKIELQDVSFAYGKYSVISDISLTLHPGDRIAILGPTGSGKSTLVSLIPRFYEVNSGCILVTSLSDIHNVNDLDLKSWRDLFGIVHQEVFLFGRSIKENIMFGDQNATDEEIEQVAKIAQVDTFVQQFPDKYDTIIGERGVTLSGGQKQRVAIARMLLKKPRIMILDDATSSVDISTESEFQQAFEKYVKNLNYNPIVIFITHRLSTVKMANQIVIMNKGRIVEQGNHKELLEKGKIYPALWQTQEAGMVDLKLALEEITKVHQV
jgi:ABC-type multidrug transport system fused ATPase/permease subunit